ncbi:MAG: aspartate kinase, partial [Enterobacterales bacterium]|nr:aspartate kinase [Enterobacterales bacterium]
MKVLKFGGSSLADAERFDKVANIITESISNTATATVVSAPQTVTNRLVALTNAIPSGTATQHIAPIEAHLSGLLQAAFQIHPDIDQAYCLGVFKELIAKLHQWTQGAELLGHCPEQTYAQIVVTGERFSILLLDAILKTRFKQVAILEPQDFITIKEGSSDPVVNLDETLKLFEQHYDLQSNVILMPGFSARDHEGRPTTLGRNGSDYSAAILAVCVKAEICEVWTDVDGVYNSDPNLITDAQLLETMSYHEAMELSYFGAKILHPKTITPLRQYEIPCRIKNTHSPENPGTLISKKSATKDNIRAVTNMPDVALFTVSGPVMKSMAGIASRIFNTIKEASLSVIMISQSSAEHSISFCVPGQEAKLASKCLKAAFQLELESGLLDPIKLQTQLAMITIVGDRMQNQRGIAAKFFTALAKARVNIIAIAQDSSERSISAVVRAKRLDDATKICHRSLFKHHAT